MTKILVIDDEETIRENLKNLLEIEDYKVFTAANGQKGLETVEKERPEIVILDIKMPGMDGIEVLKRIKKVSKETEVIMITGHGGIETAIDAMKEGAFHYIQKPIEYSELDIFIKKALEKQKAEQRLRKLSHAVEQSPSTVMITDTRGNIEYVNPKFTQITGYSPEDVIGKNPRILKSGETHSEGYRQLWKTITSGGEWRGEFHNRKKNGELYWELASISPIKNQEGVITHFVAVKVAITERKKMEEELYDRIENEKIIASLSTLFITPELEDIDNSINHALKTIGKFCNVDRSYVLLLHDYEGRQKMENTYEWCADGIEPHIERRQELSLFSLLSEEDAKLIKPHMYTLKGQSLDNFPWFKEKIHKFEIINIPSVENLPPEANNEKKEFQLVKTKSLIHVPLVYGRKLSGFLGFDSVKKEKSWSNDEIMLLKTVGYIILNAIERKKAEEGRERFRTILDQAGEAIFIIDPDDGHFLDINKSAEDQLGYTREELLGMSIKDINASLEIQTPELWKEYVKNIKDSGKPLLVQTVHKRKDAGTLKVDISISYKTHAGEDYILATARDITERERVKKLVESQQKQLIQADKMISIGTMAAGVAHEINNPLNVAVGDVHLFARDFREILGLVDSISKTSLPPDARKEIEKLKKDIDLSYTAENFKKKITRCEDAMGRIKEIVQNLRDFSQVDKSEMVDFDITKGIESTLQLVPKKYKHTIEIKTEYAPVPTIPCYGNQLNQVFMNIIVNALQAMKGGGTLKIVTSSDDMHIYVKFVDNGPGIPENKLKKIFDPFYTTKPVGEGTGLGLAITYSIVEKHGGVISAVNNPDKGVTFTIKLLKTGVKTV